MGKIYDFIGKTFERLTVVEKLQKRGNNGCVLWKCVCSCKDQTEVIKSTGDLVSGNTRSCGCFRQENTSSMFKKHGLANTPEYGIWLDIKKRCYNRNYKQYADYGGRGITMCDEWKDDFTAFYHDMGQRPSFEHSIDRKDNELGYSKSNCRWATREEQANNTRSSVRYKVDGEDLTIAEISKKYSIPYTTLRVRLLQMSVETAILLRDNFWDHLFTIDHVTKTIKEWLKVRKIRPRQLISRLYKGWSISEALESIQEKSVSLDDQILPLSVWCEILGYEDVDKIYLRIIRGETLEDIVKNDTE